MSRLTKPFKAAKQRFEKVVESEYECPIPDCRYQGEVDH